MLALAVLGAAGVTRAGGECAIPRPAADCASACCDDLACCVQSAQEKSQPAPMQAPPRSATMLAAILPSVFSLLYELPPSERKFVIPAGLVEAHALPPLAASCIRLI